MQLDRVVGFEWDKGNIDKSYEKHGITPNEAEEVFVDEDVWFQDDIDHSQHEARFTVVGKTNQKHVLFIAFATRGSKIRIISARRASIKERREYEKRTKKNTTF